jgi:hypothetical protein
MNSRAAAFISFVILGAQLAYYIFLLLFVNKTDEVCLGTSDSDKQFLTAVEVITWIEAIGVGLYMLYVASQIVSPGQSTRVLVFSQS